MDFGIGLDAAIMIIPQMVKTIKLKDTSGVSLMLFIIFLVANTIALAYALLINQMPLIIKYAIAITTTLIYLGLYGYYYNKKKSK